MITNNSIFEKKIHPLRQASGVALVVMFILTIIKLVQWTSEDPSLGTYWEISTASLLFFAIMNSVLSLAYENQNFYWMFSLLGYAGLLFLAGALSTLYSGLNIDEAGAYRWMFLMFTMSYIILLAIVRSMKKIMIIAQREDSRLRGEE